MTGFTTKAIHTTDRDNPYGSIMPPIDQLELLVGSHCLLRVRHLLCLRCGCSYTAESDGCGAYAECTECHAAIHRCGHWIPLWISMRFIGAVMCGDFTSGAPEVAPCKVRK